MLLQFMVHLGPYRSSRSYEAVDAQDMLMFLLKGLVWEFMESLKRFAQYKKACQLIGF